MDIRHDIVPAMEQRKVAMAILGKSYLGFWLERQWVSRCERCGKICFTVYEEDEHNKIFCNKEKLTSIDPGRLDFCNPPDRQ